MNHAIQKALKVSEEEAAAFITRAGSDIAAGETILGWTPETQPKEIGYMKRDLLQRALYQCKLSSWAKKWPPAETSFLKEASLFELTVTYTINPTYPMLAFRVPLKACLALAEELGLVLSEDILGYAMVMEALQHKKVLTREAILNLYQQHGFAWMDPEGLVPFPPTLLDDHVLGHVNVFQLAPGQVMQHAPRRGLDVLRERKEMCNRIVKMGDNYQIHEGAEEFVRLIMALNKPL